MQGPSKLLNGLWLSRDFMACERFRLFSYISDFRVGVAASVQDGVPSATHGGHRRDVVLNSRELTSNAISVSPWPRIFGIEYLRRNLCKEKWSLD